MDYTKFYFGSNHVKLVTISVLRHYVIDPSSEIRNAGAGLWVKIMTLLTVEFQVHLGGRLSGVQYRKEGCYYLVYVFKYFMNFSIKFMYYIL